DRSRDHLRAELAALVRSIEESAAARHDEASRAARAEAENAAAAMASMALAAERENAARRPAVAVAEAEQIARAGHAGARDARRGTRAAQPLACRSRSPAAPWPSSTAMTMARNRGACRAPDPKSSRCWHGTPRAASNR